MRLEAEQAWWIGKHRIGIWLGEAAPAQQFEEYFGMTPAHTGVSLAL